MSRKEMEKYFFDLSDDMDPTGINRERYEDFFKGLSDDEFYKYMKNFIKDPNLNFKIMYPPMSNKSPRVKFFLNVAKKRGVEVYEYIFMPYLNKTKNKEDAPGTVNKMLVGFFPVKRLMQTVFSKNSSSTTITNRNLETGQVKDSDKSARISDVEVVSLLAQNQYATAIEYLNPRADDLHMMRQMHMDIANKGEVSIHDLDSDILNKTAVNSMNYFMLGGGLMTNLIDKNGLLLPLTLKEKEEVNNTQSIK
jgi:hypothetical protein